MLHAHSPGHLLNPKVWQEPMSFRPERWLTDQAPPIGADRDAFVAFSKGIRNCIGQELALLEVRMVLAMTVRQFDFHEAFDEVEKLREDGSGYPSDLSGVQKQFGEKAYQIQLGTAKPREEWIGGAKTGNNVTREPQTRAAATNDPDLPRRLFLQKQPLKIASA
ncbi:hypothetical protein D6D25_06672 [Aureobasidium pullulans]|nr:hypothetical protein D6D25_06672 [Aureobasidium pullulans]